MTIKNKTVKKLKRWDFISSHLGVILGLLSLISSLFGGFFFLDGRYAKATDTKEIKEQTRKVEQRLENKIILDRVDKLQERIWKYQDRYGDRLEKAKDKLIIEEYKKIQDERDRLEKSLDKGEK